MSALLVTAVFASASLAQVSQPFPGVTLVRDGASSMLIANLCAPGVSVRTTKYGERQATPQQWAQAVGAQAAINADFFDLPGWSVVVGRARGAGEDWPADKQLLETRLYWYFGLFTAGLQENAAVPPAGVPWMTEIVGGHNQLIRDGQSLGPSFDGDAVLAGSFRRTAVGMSRDRRTLFLLATGKLLNGTGLVNELRALAAQAGAPAIDVATNMDGGGSSQLYVQGQGQLVSTGRQVNNHVGLYATGSGPSPNCNNIPPRGALDVASCDVVAGWAQDWNVKDSPISLYLSFGGPVFSGAPGWFVKADRRREDLCAPLESCDHAFEVPTPLGLLDGQPHPISAYAMDSEGGQNTEVQGSPKVLQCARPPPAGVLRHVPGDGWAPWRFDAFVDVQPVGDALLTERTTAAPWPITPRLIRAAGTPEVYLVDGRFRRHVTAAAVAPWHLDLSTVEEVSADERDVFKPGPPVRERPWLVKGAGPAIFVVDDELPAELPPPAPAPRPEASAVADATWASPAGPEGVRGGCTSSGVPPAALLLALLMLRRHHARRLRSPVASPLTGLAEATACTTR